MSSVSNTVDGPQVEARPSREQCLREAGGVYASWRAERTVEEVAA
ncbi:hypothetical protein ACT17S_00425 [Glutamicibacter mysorens]